MINVFQCIPEKQVAVETPIIRLNEEFLQQVSHTQIAFGRCSQMKSCFYDSCKKKKRLTARL